MKMIDACDAAYRNGYEKGKADATKEIVRCADCKHLNDRDDNLLRKADYTRTIQEAIRVLDELGGVNTSEPEYPACRMAISALEMRIPKKLKITLRGSFDYNTIAECPTCECSVNVGWRFCAECGQRLYTNSTIIEMRKENDDEDCD